MRPMARNLLRVIVLLAAVAVASCNRGAQTPAPTPEEAPAPAEAPAAPQPPSAPPIPAATELPLNTVDSVMLTRPQDAPMAVIIRVTGTAISPGWTGVKLVEDAENATAGVARYKLVATSPAMPDANRTPEVLEAELRVDALPATMTTIRILSATNEISAPVAQ